jgi:hypothetical protein
MLSSNNKIQNIFWGGTAFWDQNEVYFCILVVGVNESLAANKEVTLDNLPLNSLVRVIL